MQHEIQGINLLCLWDLGDGAHGAGEVGQERDPRNDGEDDIFPRGRPVEGVDGAIGRLWDEDCAAVARSLDIVAILAAVNEEMVSRGGLLALVGSKLCRIGRGGFLGGRAAPLIRVHASQTGPKYWLVGGWSWGLYWVEFLLDIGFWKKVLGM